MTIPSLSLADFRSIRMDFDDTKKCWEVVPARPGWYAIETDAPLAALADFPLPKEEGEHYRIAKRLEDVAFFISQGVAIVPAQAGAMYVAYSGEHGDLKSRARQHICGHKGTGCLSLRSTNWLTGTAGRSTTDCVRSIFQEAAAIRCYEITWSRNGEVKTGGRCCALGKPGEWKRCDTSCGPGMSPPCHPKLGNL